MIEGDRERERERKRERERECKSEKVNFKAERNKKNENGCFCKSSQLFYYPHVKVKNALSKAFLQLNASCISFFKPATTECVRD